MQSIKTILKKHQELQPYLQRGSFGIEREGLRVTEDGSISLTDHPHIFGSRSFHPYIQTDFAESQLELITPTTASVEEAVDWLDAIIQVTTLGLPEDEYIWPLSMPYDLSHANDIRVAQLEEGGDVAYREGLIERYGKNKQLVSGVHFNFGLDDTFIQTLYKIMQPDMPVHQFQTECYLKITKFYFDYEWLLTYLYGASPLVDARYFDKRCPEPLDHPVKSLRVSDYGYVNNPRLSIQNGSLEDYVNALEEAVKSGAISAEKEYYSGIRYRGKPSARELLESGIKYIECRHVDLHPFDRTGVSRAHLKFLHAFLVYGLLHNQPIVPEKIEESLLFGEELALYPVDASLNETKYNEAKKLLQQMSADFQAFQWKDDILFDEIAKNVQRLNHVEQTLSMRVMNEVGNKEAGMQLARSFKTDYERHDYQTIGFEDLELSTQAVLFDAIQKGIAIRFVDRYDQLIELSYNGQKEWVKSGNMTSLDTYITPLVMENKTATKMILSEAGISVPGGNEYHAFEEAARDYAIYHNKAVVVKPKDTNMGIGITILKPVQSQAQFEQALAIAFKSSKHVLVEEFAPGTEYRFFVLDGSVRAVLKREPAHVIGDGKQTIQALIDEKNKHHWRGEGHQTPLVKITVGESGQMLLDEQGVTLNTVPKIGERIELRRNSNISTGGDSVDMTDEMPNYFKKVAVQAAQSLEAVVCGIDMMILDLSGTDQTYSIIEANFNPMMSMHIFPAKGTSRRLSRDVLETLFKTNMTSA